MELAPDDPLSAVYVDLNTMTITLSGGETVPITNLFDDCGEECEPDEAIMVVGGSDARGWWTVPIHELGILTIH